MTGEPGGLEFKLALFDVGGVQQIVYQNSQPPTAALDDSKLSFLLADQISGIHTDCASQL